jgi:PhoPQ-activated pathogenicity-related protein
VVTLSRRKLFRAGLNAVIGGLFFAVATETARAGLDEYVKKPDPAYSWQQISNQTTPAGIIHNLKLTSQMWHGIKWNHDLRIYEPREIAYPDTVLLFITGGSSDSQPKEDDHKQAFGLGRLCGARVAVLPQVPNQPLLDGKNEDELIAETFVRYLQTQDESWPLLFPMVKSAVRAMDAVQAWAKDRSKAPVTRFVVTGASKRGWTTWLTGAVDNRVVAIAPIVIVMLNLSEQGPNQLKVWGQYSEQIHDYVDRGLMQKAQTPGGARLWNMVDPFSYRDRLTKPKFLINGTNDRYWSLNALDLYWDELRGPKYLVELPNAGHGLEANREWALNGLGAFFRHVVTNRPLPQISWSFVNGGKNNSALTIHAAPAPQAARLWTARSQTRDFRDSRWDSSPLEPGESITGRVAAPVSGCLAAFGELEYQIDGLPYHLTTSFVEPGLDRQQVAR